MDKELGEIFSEIEIVKTELGEFIKITNPFGTLEENQLILKEELELIQETLTFKIDLIPGVGNKSSNILRKKNINRATGA